MSPASLALLEQLVLELVIAKIDFYVCVCVCVCVCTVIMMEMRIKSAPMLKQAPARYLIQLL